ncbi:ceramide-1-phosphate transfer protein-like [Menidia menidia]
MAPPRSPRPLLLAAALTLLLFISSFWLPQAGTSDCSSSWLPCLTSDLPTPEAPLAPPLGGGAESEEDLSFVKECPGQSFQTGRLLRLLRASLAEEDDVLLEAYLQSWDQLLEFMDSLGPVVSFFSQKVREKVTLIRVLSAAGRSGTTGKPQLRSGSQSPGASGGDAGAYRSLRSMVDAERRWGTVDFVRRSDSGCRTLLRLHRSLLWLKLTLKGLSGGADASGRLPTPGELGRAAYRLALAPHHPWLLRRAAELAFLALPPRQHFLELVCVRTQEQATPILRVLVHALTLVHAQTQRILEEHGMLELP